MYIIKINRSLFITIIFYSTVLLSQDISQDFLSDLPDAIVTDILDQSLNKSDKIIENPDTRIQSLESALDDIEKQLQSVRSGLEKDDGKSRYELEIFGRRFFDTIQSTFAPINEPNPSADYLLDYGDYLSIQFVGQLNEEFDKRVKRDGTINISQVGNISVAGLTLRDASSLIQSKVSNAYVGLKTFVSLMELRDMNLLIVGNVERPGMYTLSGASSALSLIHAAGGINKNGSYRYISHKRNNKLIQNIDLYDLLIQGDLKLDNRLRSGDVIIVHPRLNHVRVSGGFANPAIYELKESESLDDLLEIAGMRKNHSEDKIQIERYQNSKFKNYSIQLSDASSFSLSDGDSVELVNIEPEFRAINQVNLSGQVTVPGVYKVSDNTRLSDLLEMAGGYTEEAYLIGGVFTRRSIKDLEIESKEKGYNELLRYLVSSPNFGMSGFASDGVLTFLSLLKEYEPSGRLVTEFNINNLKQNPSLDRILKDGDTIHIPSFMPEVFVFGEVMNPGAIPYQELMRAGDYIDLAGSYSRVSDQKRVVVISPDGRINMMNSGFLNLSKKPSIMPGSVIYVPRHVGKIDGLNLAAGVSPIISSFALSIASLNSINN